MLADGDDAVDAAERGDVLQAGLVVGEAFDHVDVEEHGDAGERAAREGVHGAGQSRRYARADEEDARASDVLVAAETLREVRDHGPAQVGQQFLGRPAGFQGGGRSSHAWYTAGVRHDTRTAALLDTLRCLRDDGRS